MERPFFQSYGANLPSSLTTNHSSALEYSSRLPVSVCGTSCIYLKLRDFSWEYTWDHYHLSQRDWCTIVFQFTGGFAYQIDTYALQPRIPSRGGPYVTPSSHRNIYRYWNINQFSIGFAFRLHLRTRLTLI